ncbi:MAG: hypothetical protein SPI59_06180 [Finegoldia sp.]|nr:hypothetical protein [Finegoldia sp.]
MKEIYAIVPIYESGVGNIIKIYFDDQTLKLSLSLESYLRKLARSRLLDFDEIKRVIRKRMGIKKNPPLWTRDECFFMVKVRKPLAKNDGSYGAFNVHFVKDVDEGYIFLANDEVIEVLESKNSIENKIDRARDCDLILNHYVNGSFPLN